MHDRAEPSEVGAHTCSHPRLTACSDAALREEIGGCKRALEDLLGEPVTQFCYPYGNVDARVAATVQEAGYVAATTTRHGRAIPGSDPWRYPRIQIARHHLLPQTQPGAQ
ncbi:polysaccharide deacetylase family protein [Xanthomonas translucens pv. undulosa]|uniref:polysaccharide deacetylase family protein n=1 Tax=Xanthomonas campestris pv. translucens TaxID=343 RepID=UPI00071E8094|nr:polysaccharide deacetylase family protein [Xanthomonas translucens]WLA03957.1 polysaccharide deacetylase family protein [Xanthomonas translucens]